MKTRNVSFALLAVVAFPIASPAQEADHRLGQHPAVLVKRQQATQGYDYQAQFYPHPAWMYLDTDHHELGDHPAVLVARRNAEAAHAAQVAQAQTAQAAQPGQPQRREASRGQLVDASAR
jgi:hypothetical protein